MLHNSLLLHVPSPPPLKQSLKWEKFSYSSNKLSDRRSLFITMAYNFFTFHVECHQAPELEKNIYVINHSRRETKEEVDVRRWEGIRRFCTTGVPNKMSLLILSGIFHICSLKKSLAYIYLALNFKYYEFKL